MIRALSRSIATDVSISAIARDASDGESQMNVDTAKAYLDALSRVFVLEKQPSWGPRLRCRDRVRKAARRHFVDPSLAAAAVGADPGRLLRDLQYFGQLFEFLVTRDLRVYAQDFEGKVLHYRDSAGREVDAIVEMRDGEWLAVEVKLAASREEEAAMSLLKFSSNLDTSRTKPPRALVIVTGGKFGYTRGDGVHVVPIGTLTA